MKIRYLILLSAILFVIGCVQQPATTPTETAPTPTETPEPTEPALITTSDIVITERTVTPTETTIPAGTEVSISIEGKTPHVIQIVKAAEGALGPRIIATLGTYTDGGATTYVFEEPGSYTIKSLKVGTVLVAVTVE